MALSADQTAASQAMAARELFHVLLAELPQGAKRNAVFRADVVATAVARAEQALAEASVEEAKAIAENVTRRRRRGDAADDLARFTIVLATLRKGAVPGPTAHALLRHGLVCLQRAGVDPARSRLAHLHADLRAALAASGDVPFKASLAGAVRDDAGELLAIAERSLMEEGAVDTLTRLIAVETGRADAASSHVEVRLARARVLRLSGKKEEARELLASLDGASAAFERASIDAMASADLEPFFAGLRTGALEPSADERAILSLWSHAVPRKPWARLAPRPASLKRLGADPALVRATELLEKLYTTTLPLAARVDSCGRLLDLAEELPSVTAELLAVGAAARWLLRSRQPVLARVAARRYQATCLTLSDGRAADLFELELLPPGERQDADARDDDERDEDERATEFATGSAPDPTRRGLDLMRVGVSMLAHAAGGAGDGSATEYAMILTEHLRVLKGPAMKVGQMLSFYGLPLSDDALASLATLQDQARAVDIAAIRKSVEDALGAPISTAFGFFDEQPFAVGSVGQVHLARTRAGKAVAVKVLFPGIEECIRRDFRSLRLLLPLLSMSMRHWNWPQLFGELEDKMLGECNLEAEAETQTAFRERLSARPDLVVPRVFRELSSRSVMISEYFDGVGVAEFARSASEEARRSAAETLTRYIMTTVFSGEFNTDMHPGNVLFDGTRVCVVDFGNVRRWTGGEQNGWRWMLESMLKGDRELLRRGLEATRHCAEELTDEAVEQTYQAIYRNLGTFLASEAPRRIDKKAILAEMLAFGPGGGFGRLQMRIPPAYVYAFRAYWGCLAILGDLDIEVAARPICLQILEEIDRADAA